MSRRGALVALGLAPLALTACRGPHSVLDPAGPRAAAIEDLWWTLFWVTTVAAALTITFTLAVVARRRRSPGPGTVDARFEDRWILVTGVAVPAVLLLGLLVATFRTADRVARPASDAALTIDVIGHQFWWEVRYPDHDVVTANELHIPAGLPVRLRLTSADVIHSFWVPRLGGKMDMTPGHVTELWLEASEPGVYRGQCAELCGLQHALMAMLVVAEPEPAHAAWVAAHQRPAAPPTDPAALRGLALFEEVGCASCHAVRGHTRPLAATSPGPDLTHLMARRTLAAATAPLTPETLRAWVVNPHALKPGNRMPPLALAPDRLADLLAFLESLR